MYNHISTIYHISDFILCLGSITQSKCYKKAMKMLSFAYDVVINYRVPLEVIVFLPLLDYVKVDSTPTATTHDDHHISQGALQFGSSLDKFSSH